MSDLQALLNYGKRRDDNMDDLNKLIASEEAALAKDEDDRRQSWEQYRADERGES